MNLTKIATIILVLVISGEMQKKCLHKAEIKLVEGFDSSPNFTKKNIRDIVLVLLFAIFGFIYIYRK